MKQAYTNTGKNPNRPTVAGAAAAKQSRSAGRRKQQMPLCHYGAGCNRKDCVYRHPTASKVEEDAGICKPYLAGMCQFGRNCFNIHPHAEEADRLRQKFAAIMCQWGDNCRSEGCLYMHPADCRDEIEQSYYETEFASECTVIEQQEAWMQPHGVENLPIYPAESAEGLCEPEPNPASAEASLPELTSGLSLNAAAAEWVPSVHASEWVPDADASEWVPSVHATEWVPNVLYSACPAHEQCAAATSSLPHLTDSPPAPGSWAAIAASRSTAAGSGGKADGVKAEGGVAATTDSGRRAVRIPQQLWLTDVARIDSASAFSIVDPLERFAAVNAPHEQRTAVARVPLTVKPSDSGDRTNAKAVKDVAVMDLHFQSVKTAPIVLDARLPALLEGHAEVWVLTGTGHHTDKAGHQRSQEGGVLYAAVRDYLMHTGYTFHPGKDGAGRSGAFLVVR